MPGVTRDRVEVSTTWRGRSFRLVDTAGFLSGARGVDALAAGQADLATAEAEVILLVVDSQAGVTEEDAALARRLLRAAVPVLVVANKVDTAREEADTPAFFALGLGGSRSAYPRCTDGPRAICSTGSSLLPDARTSEAEVGAGSRPGSRSSAGPTSASPPSSTLWWGRSAPSSTRRPVPRATPSTRW